MKKTPQGTKLVISCIYEEMFVVRLSLSWHMCFWAGPVVTCGFVHVSMHTLLHSLFPCRLVAAVYVVFAHHWYLLCYTVKNWPCPLYLLPLCRLHIQHMMFSVETAVHSQLNTQYFCLLKFRRKMKGGFSFLGGGLSFAEITTNGADFWHSLAGSQWVPVLCENGLLMP